MKKKVIPPITPTRLHRFTIGGTKSTQVTNEPRVMLLGRIITVQSLSGEQLGITSMFAPSSVKGVKVVDYKTLVVDEGVQVVVGTGASENMYPDERLIAIKGPVTLHHGEIVKEYTEANQPPKLTLTEILERFVLTDEQLDQLNVDGMVLCRGQRFAKEDYPELTPILSPDAKPLAKWLVPDIPSRELLH